MNEQIKQLAEQSGIVIPKDSEYNGHIYRNTIEKFAQLIVRECIEVIDSTSDNTKLMRVDPYQKIIWAIEEHFGVEQ